MATNTLVRYADFVHELGGTSWHLGWIVGVGMVGSLAGRFVLGRAIDRHGAAVIWLVSLVIFAVSCWAHLGIHTAAGVGIYIWRLVFCLAIAGIFAASTTFVSQGASPARMAELIGMLGTSGFVGVVVGTQLGDLLVVGWRKFEESLWWGQSSTVGCRLAAAATAGYSLENRPIRTSTWRVVRSFGHLSFIILGMAMGIGLGLPPVFLPAMATGTRN